MKNYVSPKITLKRYKDDIVTASDNFIVDGFDDTPAPAFTE